MSKLDYHRTTQREAVRRSQRADAALEATVDRALRGGSRSRSVHGRRPWFGRVAGRLVLFSSVDARLAPGDVVTTGGRTVRVGGFVGTRAGWHVWHASSLDADPSDSPVHGGAT